MSIPLNPFIQKFFDHFRQQIQYLFVSKDPFIEAYVGFCITKDEVFVSGLNHHGQLGLGNQNKVDVFEEILELRGKNVVEIYEGNECMFARTERGLIYGWGGNNWGQLGRGTDNKFGDYFEPTLIEAFKDQSIINIACGKTHNLALSSDGSVYGWGDNYSGQVGCDQTKSTVCTPVRLNFANSPEQKMKSIYCFKESSFAISDESEQVYIWGQNVWFKTVQGLEKIEKFSKPTIIPDFKASKIVCNENSTYHIHKNSLYFDRCALIDKDVQDILLTRDTMMYLKENTIYLLKSNEIIPTSEKTFKEYLIKKQGITQMTAKYSEIRNLFERTRKSLGSLSRPPFLCSMPDTETGIEINSPIKAPKIKEVPSIPFHDLNKIIKEDYIPTDGLKFL